MPDPVTTGARRPCGSCSDEGSGGSKGGAEAGPHGLIERLLERDAPLPGDSPELRGHIGIESHGGTHANIIAYPVMLS